MDIELLINFLIVCSIILKTWVAVLTLFTILLLLYFKYMLYVYKHMYEHMKNANYET